MSRTKKTSSNDTTATHSYVDEENKRYLATGTSKPEWSKSVILRNKRSKNIWTELYQDGGLVWQAGVKPQ